MTALRENSDIRQRLQEAKSQALSSGETITVSFHIDFNSGDLYYALHGANVEVSATYVSSQDIFSCKILVTDCYDFAYQGRCDLFDLQCKAVNHAYNEQKLGELKKYKMEMGFVFAENNDIGSPNQNNQQESSRQQNSEPSEPATPRGVQWVENKYFKKSDYISGIYTGDWDYSKPNGEQPNGQGTLNYASSSKMYQKSCGKTGKI